MNYAKDYRIVTEYSRYLVSEIICCLAENGYIPKEKFWIQEVRVEYLCLFIVAGVLLDMGNAIKHRTGVNEPDFIASDIIITNIRSNIPEPANYIFVNNKSNFLIN